MSDIGLILPWWLALVFLGIMLWPVTLALGLTSLAATVLTRGLVRVCTGVLTIVLAANLIFGARMANDRAAEDRKVDAFEARIHQTLDGAVKLSLKGLGGGPPSSGATTLSR